MKHQLLRLYRIIFLSGLICAVTSCATLKQDDNSQLQNENASQEEIKKDGIPKSVDQKITSLDQLIEYLGMVSPQSDEFRIAYHGYLDDRKSIIKANSNETKAILMLQERESEFLENLNDYMSLDQYNRYIAYLNQQKQYKSSTKSF